METECCYAQAGQDLGHGPGRHAVGGLHGPRGRRALRLLDRAAAGRGGLLRMSAATAQPKLRTPQQLYEDWERSHWSAQEVDLSRDGDDWAAHGGGRALAPALGPELADGGRGADLDAVLRPRAGPGRRGGGQLPVDAARGRGAPHAVLRPLPERGRGGPGRDRRPRRARAARCSASRSRRCSTRRWSTRTTGCGASRATARRRSTS